MYILVGRIGNSRVPVYVHAAVLVLTAVFFLLSFHRLVYGITFLAYIGIIFVHEIGHLVVAARLKWNVVAIKISVLHGVCEFEPAENELDEILVAWGGVLAQILVAACVFLFLTLYKSNGFSIFDPALVVLTYVNLLVVATNLVPQVGLDGYIAWKIIPRIFGSRSVK